MANVIVSARTALLPGGEPVEGLHVALYATSAPYDKLTSAFTDAAGEAALGDRAAGTYHVYITTGPGQTSESGNKLTVEVVDSSTHVFDVIINTTGLPSATDTNFCRCSGFIRDFFGRPAANAAIIFSEMAVPNLLYSTPGSSLITQEVLSINADKNGWFSVDLIRNATYSVTMTGYENAAWQVTVPDLASSSLPDILFPVPAGVYYYDTGSLITPTSAPAIALSVDETKELEITTLYLSGLVKASTSDVVFTSSDQNKLEVVLTDSGITLQAIAAGVVTVGVARREEKTTQTAISGAPGLWAALTVTVT